MSNMPRYSVDLSAEADLSITKFSVEYPRFKGIVQDFGVSAGMKYVSVSAPVPQIASCSWIKEDGETQRVNVPVKSSLPEGFDPTKDGLIFTVTSNSCISFSIYLREGGFVERKVFISEFPNRKVE